MAENKLAGTGCQAPIPDGDKKTLKDIERKYGRNLLRL